MTQLKEKRLETSFDLTSFAFGIGYSYNNFWEYPNIINLDFMFWHFNFVW